MSLSAEISRFQDKEVIKLSADKYTAIIAPFLGSNIVEMYDTELDIDFFRHDSNRTIEEMKAAAEIYGFPTLLFANRLQDGVLQASDYTYHFPVNEPVGGNHLHGFLHKREHSIVTAEVVGESAVAKTEYVYDAKDEFFEYFPVPFKAEFTFTLDAKGMHYEVSITNQSDRQMPVMICNHCAFNGPFKKGAKALDTRLWLPIGDKWELDPKTNCPTLATLPHTNHDRQYIAGDLVPVEQDIDNDVFEMTDGEYAGKPFRGAILTDTESFDQIIYEVDEQFKFWVVWNDHGDKNYFCPEPMTWMINAPNLAIPASESGYKELAPEETFTIKERIFSKRHDD